MESYGFDELGQILATKTSRRGALKAVAGGAGGIGSPLPPGRPAPPSVGMATDPVRDAERRLTAAVEPDQVPLPTVRLSIGVAEPDAAP
ncbi:MAG: hypothetical protein M3R02_13245 [Chloroflexota bacterium]|nr:hypothetical protein [Chloroflexota bacterium]